MIKGMKTIKRMLDLKSGAEKGLQNYGKNIAKRVSEGQKKVRGADGKVKGSYYNAINPFPNPFKKSSYK